MIVKYKYIYVSGWWYSYPSEKYEFVKWDYCSQLNGKIDFHVLRPAFKQTHDNPNARKHKSALQFQFR